MKGQGTHRLHAHLLTFGLAILLPVLMVTAATLWWAASAFRDTSQQRLYDTARALARAVESELALNISLMQAVTDLRPQSDQAGESLAAELAGFHSHSHQARAGAGPGGATAGSLDGPLAPYFEAVHAVTRSADGALHGLDRASLAADADWILGALNGAQPRLSNLVDPPGGGRPRVAIAVPLPGRDAPDPGAMIFSVAPTALVRALQGSARDVGEMLSAVTDGNGRLIARSQDGDKLIGREVPDWAKLKALNTPGGVFEARSANGPELVMAFQTLADTPGWVVVAGTPKSVLTQTWRQPLILLALGCLVAAGLGVTIGLWIARQILRPVQALAQHSRLVASDQALPNTARIPSSSILEFESLRHSLLDAERVLDNRARAVQKIAEELTRSERRYRAVAEIGALALWRADLSGAIVSMTGWQELTGVADEEALGLAWMQWVHPDDLDRVRRAWSLIDGEAVIDLEFRMRAADDRWRWVRARGATTVADHDTLEWVGVLEDVDIRRQAQARVLYLAQHDAMTGLANRALLRDRLDEAVAAAGKGQRGAILCLDLDRFRAVNDSLGHQVGDALLRVVTERLRAQAGPADLVARLGADEFAVIQPDGEQPEAAARLATRLIERLGEPYTLVSQQVSIGASVGIAIIDHEARNAESLLKSADLALYQAKEEGGGRYRFFEPEMDARMQRRQQLELELQDAVRLGQFVAYFQPLVDLRSRSLAGFEALIRWVHPSRGVLAPFAFVHVLEETGLIAQAGEQMLSIACHEAARWPAHLKVAVNISPVQLADRRLADVVTRALSSSGLDPSRLELEITENALLSNIQAATGSLLALKSLGISVVMDDFGTGQSSLGYLRAFPFDKVKIDRSFVRDVVTERESRAIVRAIIILCESLGISTTAEGIEEPEQLELISREGCSLAQGYLFGKPLPVASALTLIEDPDRIWAGTRPALPETRGMSDPSQSG